MTLPEIKKVYNKVRTLEKLVMFKINQGVSHINEIEIPIGTDEETKITSRSVKISIKNKNESNAKGEEGDKFLIDFIKDKGRWITTKTGITIEQINKNLFLDSAKQLYNQLRSNQIVKIKAKKDNGEIANFLLDEYIDFISGYSDPNLAGLELIEAILITVPMVGGCDTNSGRKITLSIGNHTFQAISVKTTGNNCFIASLASQCGIKVAKGFYEKVRKECGIDHQDPVDLNTEAERICKHFNAICRVWSQENGQIRDRIINNNADQSKFALMVL